MDQNQYNKEFFEAIAALICDVDFLKKEVVVLNSENAQSNSKITRLEQENIQLKAENKKLKTKLLKYETPKNSSNSNRPSSSDFPKQLKTQSLRGVSDKKPGGQPGHIGTTLKMVENPDILLDYIPTSCTCCGENLINYQSTCKGRRQVIDIPPIKPIVTEHRVFEKQCRCGHVNTGSFPDEVTASISYGASVQSLVAYLSVRQYIPVDRTTEILSSVFGLSISTGGVCYLMDKLTQKAMPVYESIRQKVLRGNVIGADETGVNINGKNNWAWTFQSPLATYIAVNKSRGYKAIKEIMPEGFINKILVTDCWPAYFKTDAFLHQLCTAHLLRELKYFSDQDTRNTWVRRLSDLITNAIEMRKEGKVTATKSQEIERTLEVLLKEPACKENKSLIAFQKRMVKYSDYIFCFLENEEIPPDNNGSERAIRNFKVKQKVSGYFKTLNGAQTFASLRSIIDTAIKNQQNPYKELQLIAST